MTIQELKALITSGGATFKNGAPIIYKSGYQVAILYDTIEYDDDEDLELLLSAINNRNLQDGGIWYNTATRKIEVDLLTVHIDNKMDALNLAQHFNQKAIFEWSTFESIDL